MSELGDLYQEVILDHSRHPHNYGPMPEATRKAEGYNPLCGDLVTVYVKLDHDHIQEVRFEGHGCAISKSSASVMTDVVRGKTIGEVKELFEKFRKLVMGDNVGAGSHARPQSDTRPPSDLGQAQGPALTIDPLDKLSVFSGVSEFPTRVKCAVLAWHTLRSALDKGGEKITTEGL
jgi:nitrogen fixation protein NifU and related proteins